MAELKPDEVESFMALIPDGRGDRARNADKYVSEADKKKLNDFIVYVSKNRDSQWYDKAYKIIAEVSKSSLNNYNSCNHSNRKSFHTVPLCIRKAIYFVVYARYVNEYGVVHNDSIKIKRGFQEDTIDNINKELQAINATFTYSNKSFNSDKWDLSPYNDFKKGIFVVYKVPFKYMGQKNGIYGFMISSLYEQCYETQKFEVFLDAFGGSGAAVIRVPEYKGVKKYINDYDPIIYNFYNVMKNDYSIFIKQWRKIFKDIKQSDSQVDYAKNLFNQYKDMIKNRRQSIVDLAIAFCFTNSFTFNGSPSAAGITDSNLKKFIEDKKDFESGLKIYSKRMKKVNILNGDAIALIRDARFNNSSTLCYLDSPYVATNGYNIPFDYNQMIDLLNNLALFKGRFVFSCRAANNRKYSMDLLWDEYDIDYYDNKYQKKCDEYVAQDEKLAKFFEDFGRIFNNKLDELYVLYQSNNIVSINDPIDKKTIEDNIDNSRIFEIMITNFDFNVPDINHFEEASEFSFTDERKKGFCKMKFDDFCGIVIPYLKRPLAEDNLI